jgi:hypothetical protein
LTSGVSFHLGFSLEFLRLACLIAPSPRRMTKGARGFQREALRLLSAGAPVAVIVFSMLQSILANAK